MIISRRPKSFASTEYAPGPRNKTFKSMVAAKTSDSLESNGVWGAMGSEENRIPAPTSMATLAATGVSSPTINRLPARNAATPTSQIMAVASGSLR